MQEKPPEIEISDTPEQEITLSARPENLPEQNKFPEEQEAVIGSDEGILNTNELNEMIEMQAHRDSLKEIEAELEKRMAHHKYYADVWGKFSKMTSVAGAAGGAGMFVPGIGTAIGAPVFLAGLFGTLGGEMKRASHAEKFNRYEEDAVKEQTNIKTAEGSFTSLENQALMRAGAKMEFNEEDGRAVVNATPEQRATVRKQIEEEKVKRENRKREEENASVFGKIKSWFK